MIYSYTVKPGPYNYSATFSLSSRYCLGRVMFLDTCEVFHCDDNVLLTIF